MTMSEADLLTGLLDTALSTGWLVHHSAAAETPTGWRTPLNGSPGLPDLILVHRDRRLFATIEAKSAAGRLEPDKVRWHEALAAAGVDARVIRPDDYDATILWLAGERLRGRRR